MSNPCRMPSWKHAHSKANWNWRQYKTKAVRNPKRETDQIVDRFSGCNAWNGTESKVPNRIRPEAGVAAGQSHALIQKKGDPGAL